MSFAWHIDVTSGVWAYHISRAYYHVVCLTYERLRYDVRQVECYKMAKMSLVVVGNNTVKAICIRLVEMLYKVACCLDSVLLVWTVISVVSMTNGV